MKKFILPLTAFGLMFAVSCGSNTTTDSASDQDMAAPSEEMTPGQHLDTVIEQTKAAADEAQETMTQKAGEAKEAAEESADKAAQKIKVGLQKATIEAKDVATEAKDKVKEGVGKAAESVEQTAKDVKEDMKKK